MTDPDALEGECIAANAAGSLPIQVNPERFIGVETIGKN